MLFCSLEQVEKLEETGEMSNLEKEKYAPPRTNRPPNFSDSRFHGKASHLADNTN